MLRAVLAAVVVLIAVLGAAFAFAEVTTWKHNGPRYGSQGEAAEIRYTREGPFLDWGRSPSAGSGAGLGEQRLDSHGIPLVKLLVGDRLRFVYSPIRITQDGLSAISYFERGKGRRAQLETAIRMGDWLVEHQDHRSGAWTYDFEYSPPSTGGTLRSGWPSTIVQGLAMSLLTRLYAQTENQAYLAAARRAVRPLERPVERGGLLASLRGHPFFEEYPTRPPSFVLNGFIFTLLGLYDVSPYSQQAHRAYRAGRKTLQQVLPLYDEGRRGTAYNLVHLTNPGRSIHWAGCLYVRLHVVLLDAMNSIEPNAVYRQYRDRWYQLPCGNTPGPAQASHGELNLRWLIPIGMLLLGAAASALLALLLPRDRWGLPWTWAVFAHIAAAALAAAVWLSLGFRVAAKSTLSVDGLALETIAVIGVCGALATAIARAALEGKHSQRAAPAALCAASAACAVLVAATNVTLVALGITGLALSGLIVTSSEEFRSSRLRVWATYLLLAVVAVVGALVALVFYVRQGRSGDLSVLGRSIPDEASTAIAVLAALASATLLLWAARQARTRRLEEGAWLPLDVAPYLLAVALPALILSLGRTLQLLLPFGSLDWPAAIAAVSVAAMTAGNLAALRQRDMRRVIAYASVAQIGYGLAGISALTSTDGLPATVFFLTTYSIATVTAFAAVVAIVGEHGSGRVASLKGLARRHPWWSGAFVLAVLSLAGVPPLPGFFGKLEVLEAGGDAHGAWLVSAGVANAVLSLIVYVRLLAPILRPGGLPPSQPALESPSRLLTATLLIAVLVLVAIAGLTEQLLQLAENSVAWGG
jgi:NADH-quinone oxidoreductase subunit N